VVKELIPVSGPWITQKEIDYVADAAANAWYSKANIYNDKFEKAFAEYLGVNYAVSLPSCTSAIHLSLLACGVEPGDEVIVPDITWIATSAPINYVGAIPVFADVDPKTWCLAADSFEECITPRTKAVVPVDLYGSLPDWGAIREIGKQNNIAIVEDAAEAIGSEYNKHKAGSFGETGTFSFHGAKTLTTGEGGMLVTNERGIFDRVLFLRDHGRKPGDIMFFNAEVAYKYKMSSMQAALGLAQLERIEELVTKKRLIFKWYEEELSGIDGVSINYEPPGTKNTYWMVTILFDESYDLSKKKLVELLRHNNIDSRPFFHPLSSIPAYEKHPQAQLARERNKVSYQVSARGVNLPCGMNLDQEKISYVCTTLKQILSEHRLS
jgi:perosamine synthetase